MRDRSLTMAWLSVVACFATGSWGWAIQPDRPLRWAFVAFFVPGLWGFLELMQAGSLDREREAVMNWHRVVIGWFGLLMTLAVAPRLAIAANLLDASWAPLAVRAKGVVFGGGLAIWGNYLPKLLSPWEREHEPFDWQGVHRFCGWVSSLSGIALVAVWLFFPLESAKPAAATVVVTFIVLCVGRKFFSLATHSPPTPRAPERRTSMTR